MARSLGVDARSRNGAVDAKTRPQENSPQLLSDRARRNTCAQVICCNMDNRRKFLLLSMGAKKSKGAKKIFIRAF